MGGFLSFGVAKKHEEKLTVHRFEVGDPEALNYLESNGYVVFANVLNQQEVKKATSLFWDYAEDLHEEETEKIDRNNQSTWGTFWPGWHNSGIIPEDGIGQSEFLWYIRQNDKVHKVYSTIWDTEELLVSFDGCGAFRPIHEHADWKTNSGWWHVDQNPLNLPGRVCVQGFVSLTDQNIHTGGFHCKPTGHNEFNKIKCNKNQGNFISLYKRQHGDILAYESKLVECKAGDMVLWDSRLPHCNTPCQAEPKKTEGSELLRLVAYVCMTPKTMCAKDVIEIRKQAVLHGITTSHWPHEFNLASKKKDIPIHLELTEKMKKLIGYEEGEKEVKCELKYDFKSAGYYQARKKVKKRKKTKDVVNKDEITI